MWAYLWDQVRVPHTRIDRAYIEYTNKLDTLTTSSVEWEPYGGEDALPFQLSNVCGADDYFYSMRCPLICFYAVEYHLPDRVACQFGVRQLWPMPLFSTGVDLHKLDRQRNKKIFDWERHHQSYIEEWEEMHDNVDDNNEMHTNREFRWYQAWYRRATRCRLRLQWTETDYANIESSDDEDTAYDQSTRAGRQEILYIRFVHEYRITKQQ
ncbi:serine/threonine-protein phosphatase 7 long form homolog [Miscanthus floridulus]|uniref:serine/threonine-protein phosphatase 7 long form homolog n=1 Tax=Miscanthus floridulus TaxID=154761 RepID=UPI0034576E93